MPHMTWTLQLQYSVIEMQLWNEKIKSRKAALVMLKIKNSSQWTKFNPHYEKGCSLLSIDKQACLKWQKHGKSSSRFNLLNIIMKIGFLWLTFWTRNLLNLLPLNFNCFFCWIWEILHELFITSFLSYKNKMPWQSKSFVVSKAIQLIHGLIINNHFLCCWTTFCRSIIQNYVFCDYLLFYFPVKLGDITILSALVLIALTKKPSAAQLLLFRNFQFDLYTKRHHDIIYANTAW